MKTLISPEPTAARTMDAATILAIAHLILPLPLEISATTVSLRRQPIVFIVLTAIAHLSASYRIQPIRGLLGDHL